MTRGAPRWRTARRATAVIVVICALGAAGMLAYQASSHSPLESASSPEPLVASVGTSEQYEATQVGVALTYASPVAATTQASGTVTSVGIAPGSQIHAGDVVMTVDAGDVVAYASERPLYRDIAAGDTGDDVEAAQELLASLGYLDSEPDGIAGALTSAAITAFNAEHGYGSTNPVLSRASLTWIDDENTTVSEVEVSVAQEISPGMVLWSAAAAPVALAVTETTPISQEGTWEIDVYGVTASYDAGSGTVTDPTVIAAIAEAMGSVAEGVATVRLAEPHVVGTVPSSAVVSDDGLACLFPSIAGAPVVVEPTGGDLGTVEIDAALAGSEVLVNPREVREDLSCD